MDAAETAGKSSNLLFNVIFHSFQLLGVFYPRELALISGLSYCDGYDGYTGDRYLITIVPQETLSLPISLFIFQSVPKVFINCKIACLLQKYPVGILLRN